MIELSKREYIARQFGRGLWSLAGLFSALALWEAGAVLAGNPGVFPHLGDIATALFAWGESGLLVQDLLESLPRVFVSALVAAPFGIILGLTLGPTNRLRLSAEWLIHFIRSLPPVALLPLFILWFGISWWSKLAASIFVCIFPVAVTTAQASIYADRQYRELSNDLGLNLYSYVMKIVLPAAFPAIVPGIRLSLGTAFVMLYVSELAGASVGIGYRISISQLAYRADLMVAGLLVLGISCIADGLRGSNSIEALPPLCWQMTPN